MSLEPLLTKVLWNRMISIVDESVMGLLRTCYSTVVRDYNDYCVGIFDVRGHMLVHSTKSTPGFIGMMPTVMHHFLEQYPAGSFAEGDVLITNDPWLATGHLLDVTLATPIFVEGKLIGFAVCVVHQLDIGGRLSSLESKDIYEEGLKIPIMKLVDAGVANEAVFKFVAGNVRLSHKVVGDLKAQMAANNICCKGVAKMVREYQFSDLAVLADTIVQLSERSMRQKIRELPNGVYHNHIKLPPLGLLKEWIDVKVSVEIADDTVIVDYAGTSGEVEAAVNVTLPFTVSYTTYAIKVLLDPEVPNNAGGLAPIVVKAPEGGLLNCRHPAPTMGRTIIAHNLPEAIFGALAQAMPDRVLASCGSTPLSSIHISGRKADGRTFLQLLSHMGGMGGSNVMDGNSTRSFPYNTGAIPIEVTENDTAVFYVKREYLEDSAGPGLHRGGLGQEVILKIPEGDYAPRGVVLASIRGSSRVPDSLYPVRGRQGGGYGRGAKVLINGEEINQGLRHRLKPGDEVNFTVPGGGGHGNPHERDAILVRDDVVAGLVSKAAAFADYGVVLKNDLTVDVAATAEARGGLRQAS
jgi:N-methylhydantoinase B/oxoprolinase/acetone carboxylase alpha subunit